MIDDMSSKRRPPMSDLKKGQETVVGIGSMTFAVPKNDVHPGVFFHHHAFDWPDDCANIFIWKTRIPCWTLWDY